MKTILSFFILACLMQQANAQIQWQHCYGGSAYDICYAIRATYDSGYILAGYATSTNDDVHGNHGNHGGGGDFWVVKITALGDTQWEKCYGGSGDEIAYDIRQTADSGYIVAGYTTSNDGDVTGNHGGKDMWVIKISATGVLQWQKCLGGSLEDIAYSVTQTNDSGYIFAGYTVSNDGDVIGNHGGYDLWMVKLMDTGSIEWTKCYGGSRSDVASSVQQTFDGGYIVGGSSDSDDGDVTGHHGDTTTSDMWVMKLTVTGSMEWEKSLGGGSYDGVYAILQTTDSGYIAAGETWGSGGDVTGYIGGGPYGGDGWIVKLTKNGTKQWDKCVYVSGNDEINAIQQTNDGGYLFAGRDFPYMGIGKGILGKLSNIGSIDWMGTYGGITGGTDFMSVAPTNDSSFIAAGNTSANNGDVSGNHGVGNYWVAKFGDHTEVTNIEKTNTFTIVPNPVKNNLSITTSYNIATVNITNILGQQVFSSKYDRDNVQIDVSTLPKGMYFVKVNGFETRKFVKE